jgi:ornithine lipid ester-linked acyl 2-hydroxylase
MVLYDYMGYAMSVVVLAVIIAIVTVYLLMRLVDGYTLTRYISNVNKLYIHKHQNGSDIETFDTNDNALFQKLRNNWTTIRDEYIDYDAKHKMKTYRSKDLIPMNAGIDTGDIPWENIILRAYNKDTELITYFPNTYNLIRNDCTFAMFSILPPGKKIAEHYGPYNGILRYHLGLIIPKDKNKDSNCFLMINDNKYTWDEGGDILFDDTLVHSVENNTTEPRVVLFLDVHRPFDNPIIDALNKMFLYFGKFNTSVDTIVDNTNKLILNP